MGELQSVNELAKVVVDMAKDPARAGHIEFVLKMYLNDVFSLVNNINNTSLNQLDRASRFIDMEAKYGIPNTKLILQL